MSVTTAIIDGLDLITDPYTIESYEFPPAVPNDDANSDMNAGSLPSPGDYTDPSFTLTVIVKGDTAQEVRESVATLTRRIAPGVMVTWAEDGCSALNTYVRIVQCSADSYFGTFARIVFTGTRDPFWHGPWYDLVSMAVPCWSSAQISGAASALTVSGEVDAQLVLRTCSPQATTWMGWGVKHAPASGYSPVDDYSGITGATYVGGAKSASGTLSTSYAVITGAPSLDMEANRGNHILCARVETNQAGTYYKGCSVASAEVGAAVSADLSPVASPSAQMRGVVLGRVRTPVVDMPYLDSQAGAAPSPVVIQQTSGDAYEFPHSNPAGNETMVYQTFVVSAGVRIASVAFKTDVSMDSVNVYLYSASSGTPVSQIRSLGNVDTPESAHVSTIECDVAISAGTYALVLECLGRKNAPYFFRNTDATSYPSGVGGHKNAAGVWTAGDGTDTSIDLYFQITTYAGQTLGISTPIKATASTGKANLDVVARIPADELAVVATRTAAAGEGMLYDASLEDVYVANSAGKTGSSMLGTSAMVYGKHHGLRPGVSNYLVIAADTPYNEAPSAIAVSGQYRERWIHLSRG